MAPGSLAGAARLVRGRAKDLRGPNGLDDLRSPVKECLPSTGDCTPEGERTPSPVGDIGSERLRLPSTGGDASGGEGANPTVGDVGMASRVFGRVSRQWYYGIIKVEGDCWKAFSQWLSGSGARL